MSNDIPKEDTDELRDILTRACWHFSDKFGYEDIYESGRLTEFLDEVESYALQRSREAEIAGRIDELEVLARSFANEPFDAPATIYAQKRIAELTKKREENSNAS